MKTAHAVFMCCMHVSLMESRTFFQRSSLCQAVLLNSCRHMCPAVFCVLPSLEPKIVSMRLN